jgi:hypothetical protein
LIATRISIVNRKSGIVRHKNGHRIQYTLYPVTAASTQVKLLGGLDDSNTAIFLKPQLQRRLKIEDRPVAGRKFHGELRGTGSEENHFSNYEITHPIPKV